MNKVTVPNDRENESYLAKCYTKHLYKKGRPCQKTFMCKCVFVSGLLKKWVVRNIIEDKRSGPMINLKLVGHSKGCLLDFLYESVSSETQMTLFLVMWRKSPVEEGLIMCPRWAEK